MVMSSHAAAGSDVEVGAISGSAHLLEALHDLVEVLLRGGSQRLRWGRDQDRNSLGYSNSLGSFRLLRLHQRPQHDSVLQSLQEATSPDGGATCTAAQCCRQVRQPSDTVRPTNTTARRHPHCALVAHPIFPKATPAHSYHSASTRSAVMPLSSQSRQYPSHPPPPPPSTHTLPPLPP